MHDDRSDNKTIGIIGGLGPMASVYLMELITKMVDADSDQEHPRILMNSVPDIPDRTAFLLGDSDEDPYPSLYEAGKTLQDAGAGFIVIPCVTAQAFYERLSSELDIPVVSLLANVAKDITEKGISKVAVFATDGTMKTGILESELSSVGVEVVKPDAKSQSEVMHLIYDVVKTGQIYDKNEALQAYRDLESLSESVRAVGAQGVVLGCTELSIVRKEACGLLSEDEKGDTVYIDVLESLAKCAIIRSGRKLR